VDVFIIEWSVLSRFYCICISACTVDFKAGVI